MKYEPLDGLPEKADKVVWSGRWKYKSRHSDKIMAVLSGRYRCRVFHSDNKRIKEKVVAHKGDLPEGL